MCGIAGIWTSKLRDKLSLDIKSMNDSLAHRGPDGQGFWINKKNTIALGHRRLAILDLSSEGSQPMHYLDRYTITFNGEIYNYLELREELLAKGYSFRSQSDTEIIMASFHEWGLNCLLKFDGMFAFAIYDQQTDELFCARDRFGEKPFYYSFIDGDLVFASEMKAFWSIGLPKLQDEKMMFLYLVHDLVENPLDQKETFYKNIQKLKSAHYFIYKGGIKIEQINYWKLSIETNSSDNEQVSSQKVLQLLETSVKRRLRSDVAVGSSLSGGIDSSTIVALVNKYYKTNHTFSARFPGYIKDEGHFIELVSKYFNTQHHNEEITEQKLLGQLDQLVWHQEEPFQTGSIFAQWCVYAKAKSENVIVMLDGQGADEYLAGYDKDIKPYLKELNRDNKKQAQFIANVKSVHGYDVSLSLKDKLSIIAPGFYNILARSKRKNFPSIPIGINRDFFKTYASKSTPFAECKDLKSTLHSEMTNQGLEKLLKFADRNSMAHGVEVRLPFLFHELVEYVFTLNSSLFLKDGWSKAILRTAVQDILPAEIAWRKDKTGFEAPHDEWVKNKELNSIFMEARSFLEKNKFITNEYANKWKSIIAYKYQSL